MNPRVMPAIVKRELSSYFASPTGYVFITIFIFLSALAAFWLPGFFLRNLANLDQLNAWFPALLVLLVPAITMGAWAQERNLGTEELLLTLPARDVDLVLGKYLACVLIYTAALGFSLSHVLVLAFLGTPDLGVMVSTYLGYWLAGAGLIAVGMAASALTSNLTVAFILASVFCGVVIGVGLLRPLFPDTVIAELARGLSMPERFADFGRGVISLENLAYFVLLAGLGLWVNVLLVSRRHWGGSSGAGGRATLALVRGVALVVAAGSLVALVGRASARADVTAERLWSLSPETRRLLRELPSDRPVIVTAHVSPEVPSSYVQTRETLLGLLREVSAATGGRVLVSVVNTEPFTEAARDAQRNWSIQARAVPPGPEDDQTGPREVFMGVAFTSGAEQFVIPFLSRGLSVEYELVRSIRKVAQSGRKKVGILETPAGLFGSFDFQSFTSRPDWPIVAELSKQYEVVRVPKGSAVQAGLDVLVVPQPSLLTDAELAFVVDAIKGGTKAIVLEDPLPLVSPGLATSEPRGAEMNPFQRGRQPEQEPKADLTPLWSLVGANVPAQRVMWDGTSSRPQFSFEREIMFVARTPGSPRVINPEQSITSGLQEVVLLASGEVKNENASGLTFTGLLSTSAVSGYVNYGEVLQRSFFGPGGFNRSRRQVPTTGGHVLAARITGVPAGVELAAPAEGESGPPAPRAIDVVVIADLDMISPEFFELRQQGVADFTFDNVTFILNAVDVLAGDESLLELRKRRPMYRTLTRLDEARKALQVEKDAAVDAASASAEDQLAKARESLDARVSEIDRRADLDDTTRAIMKQSVQQSEQRRLDVQSAAIADQKEQAILEAQMKTKRQIDAVQNNIRLLAVLVPPIPALALAGAVFARRRARELEGVRRDRLA